MQSSSVSSGSIWCSGAPFSVSSTFRIKIRLVSGSGGGSVCINQFYKAFCDFICQSAGCPETKLRIDIIQSKEFY